MRKIFASSVPLHYRTSTSSCSFPIDVVILLCEASESEKRSSRVLSTERRAVFQFITQNCLLCLRGMTNEERKSLSQPSGSLSAELQLLFWKFRATVLWSDEFCPIFIEVQLLKVSSRSNSVQSWLLIKTPFPLWTYSRVLVVRFVFLVLQFQTGRLLFVFVSFIQESQLPADWFPTSAVYFCDISEPANLDRVRVPLRSWWNVLKSSS